MAPAPSIDVHVSEVQADDSEEDITVVVRDDREQLRREAELEAQIRRLETTIERKEAERQRLIDRYERLLREREGEDDRGLVGRILEKSLRR